MIRDIIPYLYLNARIMAKEARVLGPDKLEELVSATSIMDVVSALEETDYGEYLSDISTDKTLTIEQALLKQNADFSQEILNIIPKKVSNKFQFLKKKWDVYNLKAIIRGIHSGLAGENILKKLVQAGEFSENALNDLAACRSIEDLMAQLEDTPYRELINQLPVYEKSKNLFSVEAKLDKLFFDELWRKITSGKRKNVFLLVEYFTLVINCLNLKILFRAKRDGLNLKEVEDFLITGGDILLKAKEGFESSDINDFITFLEDTVYFQILTEALPQYEKDGSFLSLELALDRFVTKKGREISQKQPWGLGPLLGFLVVREEEAKNIRIITKSKEIGLGAEETRNLLAEV